MRIDAPSLEERQISLVVEHHQVAQAISIKVDGNGSRSPLRGQLFSSRVPPGPFRLGICSIWPGDFDWLSRRQLRLGARADVSIPDDLAPDRVHDQIGQAVVVPVGDGLRRVAPLRLGRALDRAVRSRHDADRFAGRFEFVGGRPARLFDTGAAQVFDERDVPGCVPRDDVRVAIAIPIEAAGRREGSELHIVRLLLEVFRRQELRHAIDRWSIVLDQRDATVLIADDQVEVSVGIPIERDGDDHFEVHRQRSALTHQPLPRRIIRLCASAHIWEIREAVEELTTEQVQVAVTIEVGEVRRRETECRNRSG